jgi:hypothetical protein
VIALPGVSVGGCGTKHHLRVQQPGGLVGEGEDLYQLFGDNDVGLGGGLKPVDVSVGEAQRQWSGAFDLGQVEITANRESPGDPDRFRRGAEIASRQAILAATQTTLECGPFVAEVGPVFG